MSAILSLSALLSLLLLLRAEEKQRRELVYVFKPLTTVLILAAAALADPGTAVAYKWMIVAGLGFSLAGDVFLMLPSDRFVAGLVSFLVAHIFYIVAFCGGLVLRIGWWPTLPLLAFTAVLLATVLPRAGGIKIPVAVYSLVLTTMAWAACERWIQSPLPQAEYAALGALLFVASDSTIAINRFAGNFRGAQTLILGTYFPAQWLIAMSI